jgi:glycine/D-amino acid oxidase-like deaminating enzyme
MADVDLRSGCIFWPEVAGPAPPFPALDRDFACDVAVIGGGITGALCAYHLSRAGAGVVILDRRQPPCGSTPASTGLLQYEIDTPLYRLIELLGTDHAQRAYRASHRSLGEFRALVRELGNDDAADADAIALTPRPSVYLACAPEDVDELRREQRARRAIGIDVELLSRRDLRDRLGFDRPAALWSRDALEVDPYRLTLALLRAAARRGTSIFGHTQVDGYVADEAGVTLATNRGPRVRASRVVFATGYETPEFLDKDICQLKSTYALAGQPLATFAGWRERCLIWESGKPYFYARTTPDGRAMVGGEDEDFAEPRERDALIPAKAAALAAKFRTLFPALPIEPDCCWAGTFAETRDGLPYIGQTPQFPRGFFALGYGGNGITFSLVAARIIADLFTGKRNDDAELFRFDR